jgi:hypothetical protein
VEHRSERRKQEVWLVRFLKTERGIPFNQMFAMTEYPGDILPLYSQGYSVARYLIARGGKPKFMAFVGQGMQTNNWPAAVRDFYGFESLGALQLSWLDWVVRGSRDPQPPAGSPAIQFASATTPAAGANGTALAAETLPAETLAAETLAAETLAAETLAAETLAAAPRGERPQIDDQLAYATNTGASPAIKGQVVSATSERSWYARRQASPGPSRSQPKDASIRR